MPYNARSNGFGRANFGVLFMSRIFARGALWSSFIQKSTTAKFRRNAVHPARIT